MDPDANLREQEEIEGVLCYASASQHRELWPRLLDLRQALYDWLRGGGFEPDWDQAPRARLYYGR